MKKIIALAVMLVAGVAAFAEEIEPKLVKEYAEIADWVGKLVGNIVVGQIYQRNGVAIEAVGNAATCACKMYVI